MTTGETDRPDLRVEPRSPDRTLPELLAELTAEVGDLVRTQIELVKTETKDEVAQASRAGSMFAGAAVGAYFVVLFVSIALAELLDEVMHSALAYLIVAVLHGVVAYVLYRVARERLKLMHGMPQTVATLKEDVQWAKAQKT